MEFKHLHGATVYRTLTSISVDSNIVIFINCMVVKSGNSVCSFLQLSVCIPYICQTVPDLLMLVIVLVCLLSFLSGRPCSR